MKGEAGRPAMGERRSSARSTHAWRDWRAKEKVTTRSTNCKLRARNHFDCHCLAGWNFLVTDISTAAAAATIIPFLLGQEIQPRASLSICWPAAAIERARSFVSFQSPSCMRSSVCLSVCPALSTFVRAGVHDLGYVAGNRPRPNDGRTDESMNALLLIRRLLVTR